jgi:hypothetical protein
MEIGGRFSPRRAEVQAPRSHALQVDGELRRKLEATRLRTERNNGWASWPKTARWIPARWRESISTSTLLICCAIRCLSTTATRLVMTAIRHNVSSLVVLVRLDWNEAPRRPKTSRLYVSSTFVQTHPASNAHDYRSQKARLQTKLVPELQRCIGRKRSLYEQFHCSRASRDKLHDCIGVWTVGSISFKRASGASALMILPAVLTSEHR